MEMIYEVALRSIRSADVAFADRVMLWTAQLFEPYHAWALVSLKECNCIEFIARGDERQVRLRSDKEVPYRLLWEKERYSKKRARLATFVPHDKSQL